MRHRDAEVVPASVLADAVGRTPLQHYVLWTGRPAIGQPGSLRSRAFGCVHEVGVPVSLRVLLQRAARLDGAAGLNPDVVRNGVRLHQAARPTVVILLERRSSGEFVTVTDIPHAGALHRPLRAGEVVIDARGACRLDLFAHAA
ncbi:hypothetical protein DJ021_11520 [Phenylobacterium hankyongense]|uniref:Uncharacterized protein n=1 Tax=Phenylobacterium hankyongense TaxID=1813876 RepID=A0A328B0F6_9CAUL|nr:hypothetical protein [Phenylobacterium hankyongense]RAK60389.1 hypothetical protein DJ021_11520 [Phenylobacterium hankyongense]